MARLGCFIVEVIVSAALCLPWCAYAKITLGAKTLTTFTFDEYVRKNKGVLVDFYDPTDEQWPEMKEELDTAVREARSYGNKAPIARVDVLAEPDLVRRFLPNAKFPQLMWFLHGEPTQYHRALRRSKQIVIFLLALDRDPIRESDSEEGVRTSVSRAVFAEIPKASPMYKVLEVVASKHLDSIVFAFSESDKNEIKWLEKDMAVVFTGEPTVQSMERWVQRQFVRSAPTAAPMPGESLSVSGNTFESIVYQPDKDVFLLVYAPWCGFSRKFSPVWETLSRRTKGVKHLVVAKMDGDFNTSPYPDLFSWNAYPTVFFFKAGERKPIVFHGNRTVASLVEFAQPPHGSYPWEAGDEVNPDDQESEFEL